MARASAKRSRQSPKRIVAALEDELRSLEEDIGKTGGGRPSVRRVIFMAAVIAAARKLLAILNAIAREKKPWQSA